MFKLTDVLNTLDDCKYIFHVPTRYWARRRRWRTCSCEPGQAQGSCVADWRLTTLAVTAGARDQPGLENGRGYAKSDPMFTHHMEARKPNFQVPTSWFTGAQIPIFSVCTCCIISRESLTSLKHGAKCSSQSSQQTLISLVEIRALLLVWLCDEHDHCDHFFDKRPNFNQGFFYTKK